MDELIRIGIVGFDSSHSVQFTKRINHAGIPEEQWVEGARVVLGYPGGPTIFANKERISERTRELRECSVRMVKRPEDMFGKVDAVMIEFQEGSLHFHLAEPFMEAGLPVFIDKPFTCSTVEAVKLAGFARSRNIPLLSSSSLRYALEVETIRHGNDVGNVLAVDTYSPASLNSRNPGLFNYGIHGVEMLYSLMGRGCSSVACVWNEKWEKVFARWKDGRAATFMGLRTGKRIGKAKYGFTVFGERQTVSHTIDIKYIYRELLKRVIGMFKTGMTPLPIEETIEIIAFIEAALKSAHSGGAEQRLAS